ncbi:MAG: hypothetical protein JW984_14840 [Deltaproteobacteria bacterium]|uniref:Uncharacterized protein n=1 Tax=Candidatus Zymogenus saltonus TaxID=2844893 RepID=A0A9D8PNZ8_9DELT|nr:hypothetical protein [Candidatus Zymogenus saltonus]
MKTKGLCDIIGSDFKSYHLISLRKRIRNNLKRPEARQPSVYKIITKDNRIYKLLRAEKGNKKLVRIQKKMDIFNELDYVPKIIFSNDDVILLEFIKGRSPDISGADFARAFGEILADLHNRKVGYKPEEYLAEIKGNLDFLRSQNAIDDQSAEEIWGKYLSIKPDVIRTSMVYADINKPSNYIFTQEKKLFLIDMGSFQEGRVTGEFLLGGPIYKVIDRDVFKDAYLNSGGARFIFDHQQFIVIGNLIRLAAYYLKSYSGLPFILKIQLRGRLDYSRELVGRLKEKC